MERMAANAVTFFESRHSASWKSSLRDGLTWLLGEEKNVLQHTYMKQRFNEMDEGFLHCLNLTHLEPLSFLLLLLLPGQTLAS